MIDLDKSIQDMLQQTIAECAKKEPMGSTRGRVAKPLTFKVLREATKDDLIAIKTESPVQAASSLKNIRTSHHLVAQMLAQGKRPAEVQVATGYSPARISALQCDPAFKELITHYKKEVDDVFIDQVKRMGLVMTDALEELHQRIIEDPDSVTANNLIEAIKMTADRTGHSAIQKTESKHLHLTAEDIANLKGQVIEGQIGNVKEINETTAPQNSAAENSRENFGTTSAVSGKTEIEGEASERTDLRENSRTEIITLDT